MSTDNGAKLKKYLRKVFKFDSFKSQEQYEATLTVWIENCDVLINLPPASGKSICFQLPAVLFRDKITIVIVPNANAIKYQMEFLQSHEIDAYYIHSKVSLKNRQNTAENIINREINIKFMYVTVSMIIKEWFENLIDTLNTEDRISMFVIDEAQCISQRSIDYMKLYTEIIKIRSKCPNVKFVALTSVGTDNISSDIKCSLQLNNPREISHLTWRRPNIYIQVKFKDVIENLFNDMKELIVNFINAVDIFYGIIFCRRIEETVLVAQQLTELNIPTVAYHSRMNYAQRNKNRDDWISGNAKMIAATHDFGIGLNKSSVICIIHWSLPLTIEQYYQDIGRAGRNNEKALCRIYFGVEDWMNAQATAMGLSNPLFKDFENMIQYCISDECRHVIYSRYFGININPCNEACDVCDRNIFYEKGLEKFRIFHNQRKLLLKIKYLPITEVYNEKKTEKMITNLKIEVRLNYYRRLANALVQNYERATCINKQDIEMKYLCRLARNLEYLYFSTSYEKNYYSCKMLNSIEEVEKQTRAKRLSNYILNYKFRTL